MKRFIREHGLSVHLSIQMEKGLYIPIAVDTWNVLMPVMRKLDPGNIMNPTERTLKGLIQVFALLNKKACFPIFVFDGGKKRAFKTPFKRDYRAICSSAPANTHQQGSSCKLNVSADLAQVKFPATKSYCYPRTRSMAPHYKLCWDLITAAGFPTVYVNGMEADYGCANLFHTKTVMYVWSNDSDHVFMGCDVITDLSPAFPVAVFARTVLNYLNMTYQEFASTFVDCHTNIHSPDKIYSFAAKLAEHRGKVCEDLVGEKSHARKELKDKNHDTDCESYNLMTSHDLGCTAQEPRQKSCVSVLCVFPTDAQKKTTDLRLKNEMRLPIEREDFLARCKRNKEFLDYMNGFIGPQKINERHTIIKRVPINQSPLNMMAIYQMLQEYFPTKATKWCNEIIAKCKLKQLPSLREVTNGQTIQ